MGWEATAEEEITGHCDHSECAGTRKLEPTIPLKLDPIHSGERQANAHTPEWLIRFKKIYWNVKYLIENNTGASSEQLTTSDVKKGPAGCTETEKALLTHGSWLTWTATSCHIQSHTLDTQKPWTARHKIRLARVWILLSTKDLYLWSAVLKRKTKSSQSENRLADLYHSKRKSKQFRKPLGKRETSQKYIPSYHSAQSPGALDTATSAMIYVPVAPASSWRSDRLLH